MGQHTEFQGRLSVVIPVYNGADCIRETVEKLLHIPHSDVEVILVNDGSTDESDRVIQSLVACDRRVRDCHQKNQGIAVARNTGLCAATGEYVCFCDQDDEVVGEVYTDLLSRIEASQADLGMFGTGQINGASKAVLEKLTDREYTKEAVQEQLLLPLLFRGYRYPFAIQPVYLYGSVWKCIFRRKFLDAHDLHFCRFVNYEDDWLFVTGALAVAKKVVTSGRIGYYWRIRSHSESHRKQYIPDMPKRLANFDNYIASYIEETLFNGIRTEHNIMEEWHKITFCDHYLDLYKNAGVATGKERRQAKRELYEYLDRTDYKAQLSVREYVEASAYRKRVVLTALQYFGRNVTYIVSMLYDQLERLLGHMHVFVEWERKRKMKRHRR